MDTLILILMFLALIGFAINGVLVVLAIGLYGFVAVASMVTGGLHWLSNQWERFRRWWADPAGWGRPWEL